MAKFSRRDFLIISGAAAGLSVLPPARAQSKTARVRVTGLNVDNLNRPLGLENPQPRLSWRLESDQRNVRQSAYRILVADSEKMLKAGKGDLWDSGKVSSKKSVGIQYQGQALSSRQRCWWSVQVWDGKGKTSDWGDPSWWEMGLLDPKDWTAGWLAVEDAMAKADREMGFKWIWGTASPGDVPRKFRLAVSLPAAKQGGVLYVGGTDRVGGVWIDGNPVAIEAPGKYTFGEQPLTEITLGTLEVGNHLFAAEVAPRPDEMRSATGVMTAFLRLELEDGRILRLGAGPEWRTSTTTDSGWFEPAYDDGAWESAKAAGVQDRQPWPPAPAMHLRREFAVDKTITRARLYATALGAYEAKLNGRRVGDALLTPESTRYEKRVMYRAYDVTDMLHQGANVLGLTVGDGWYASTLFATGRYAWGPPPRRVLAQLELTFSDGSRQVVATGPQWRIGPSPILRAEIYNGEVYDARLQQPGWDTPGFHEFGWREAEAGETPACRVTAQVSPPIRAVLTMKPRAITSPMPGVHVVDFGQNFAGWCRLQAQGTPGTRIEMQFAETLLPNGEVDRSNLRGAKQTDVFILRGDADGEIFEPSFTYHGFRYVQLSGLKSPPVAEAIEGIVVHSDLEMTGRLEVGHPLIQQIWRNALWTQRSNFTGIPTDCPQRDERLGYLGDAGIFWDAAAFNMDVDAFTRRHLESVADSLGPNGAYPPSAPTVTPPIDPIPGWSDGGVILPWTVWRRYDDVQVIEQNWKGMNRLLDFIRENNPDCVWRNKRSDIGDWMAVGDQYMLDPGTPHELIGTAYWAHSVDLLGQMAQAIGREDDAASLRSLHERIRRAFAGAFVKADGSVGNGSQTSYVLALHYGLVPDELRPKAAGGLVADIQRRSGALSTGILGTQFLLDVLAAAGYAGVAYDLLLRTDYPSWGYMIANGGTTIWEGWDAKVWSGPKGEKMPNSYNHYALGSVCGFLFRQVAGIDAATPGFETIVVRPVLDPRMKQGGGDYHSIMGLISTRWEQTAGGGFKLAVTIPANTNARIHLPAATSAQLSEGLLSLSGTRELRLVERSDREAVVEVGSGQYHFVVQP